MYLPFRFQNASWQWYTYLQQMLNLKWHTIVLLTNRWNIQLHSIISPRRSSWIRFVTVSYMCTKCRLDIIFGLSTFLFLKQDTAYDYLRTPETLYNLQFLLKAVEFFRNVNSCQKKLIRNYILYRYISIRVCGGTDASVPF